MKKIWIGFVITAMVLLFSQGAFAASTTGVMDNTGTVVAACTMTVSGINFGTLDPVKPTSSTSSLVIKCTSGVTYTAYLNGGSHRTFRPVTVGFIPVPNVPPASSTRNLKKTGGTQKVSYSLKMNSVSGPLWGTGPTNGTPSPLANNNNCPSSFCGPLTATSQKGKTGTGSGLPQTLTIFGSVSPTGNVPAGVYSDRVKAILIF